MDNQMRDQYNREKDSDIAVAQAEERALLEAIQALITGHFEHKLNSRSPIANALNQLIDQLKNQNGKMLDNVVKFSISTNEVSMASVKLLHNLQNVDNRTQNIASAAEQMRSSVVGMDANGQSISNDAAKSMELVNGASVTLQESVAGFDVISESVADNNEKIKSLVGFAAQVRDIADEIKGISFQTNLLALNAAVEAARAGDVGRGFSVVAHEMRSLSGRSTEATKQISELASEFEEQMEGVTTALEDSVSKVEEGKNAIQDAESKMGDIKGKVGEMTSNINQISEALKEQTLASAEVADGITSVAKSTSDSVYNTDRIVDAMARVQNRVNAQVDEINKLDLPNKVIKLAQSDHVIWKKRLVNMVSGKEGLNERELADHHSCRLGIWYDNVKDESLRHNRAFKDLMEPHRLVHTHGIRAVSRYNSGDMEGALQELDQVETASGEVLRLLQQLEREA